MSGSRWDLGVGTRAEDMDWGAADGEDIFSAQADDLLIADPRDVRRAETAPMVLTIMGSNGTLSLGAMEEEKVDPDEEYRYTEEYHRLYYSKNPRDPRMLPPLTRRRHHLVRELRGGVGEDTGFAVTSGEQTGVVGDRVQSGKVSNDNAASAGATSTGTSAEDEQVAAQALVRAYIDGFRSEWEYAKIKGYVCSFSKDQDGSRLVQRLLEKQENIVPIFSEVIPHFDELATDVFGNYVLQKLFDVVPRAEDDPGAPAELKEAKPLSRLTEKVRGQLVQLSCQTYGCRVMQKALENMRAADRVTIIHELDGKVVECVFDQNANHVVQKVVEVCPADAQFIVDAFIPDLGELACHAYGCRVLQRTFEKCHDVPEVNVRPLMEAVLARVSEFTIHQYGNYVVQHAMLNAPDDLRHRFVTQLTPQLYALSCSKFASNVAERIVTTATEEERDEIIKQLKKPLSDSQRGNYLIQMMQDTYANYVVQRFFEVVSAPQRERISELVQPFVGTVNQSVYGRHLLRKMVANNILTNSFLLGHGIDVSSPEYGGSINQSGGGRNDRGGRHGGNHGNHNSAGRNGVVNNNHNNNNGNRNGNRGVSNANISNNGNGRHMNPNMMLSNGIPPHMQGSNGNSNNNNQMFVMQSAMAPQQFQQQPTMGGYMTAAPGAGAAPSGLQQGYVMQNFGVPQQPQPQPQPQPFMGGAPQMQQSSQFVAQMPPSNGQLNFSVYSTQPQLQSQQPQQGYVVQNFSMPQQPQQFRQDNTWSTQPFMNGGGFSGMEQQFQQQQQQQPVFQSSSGNMNTNNCFLDGSARLRGGKDIDSGKLARRMINDQLSNVGMVDASSSSNSRSRRSNYVGQRTPQQQQSGY
jgi:hypothetical protein